MLSVLKVEINNKSLLWNDGFFNCFHHFSKENDMKFYLCKPGVAHQERQGRLSFVHKLLKQIEMFLIQ